MKKWYTYIIMLAALLFASCNVMEDPLHSDGECETEPVNVRLILSMMGGRGLSRALTDAPGTTGSGTVDGVHTDADRLGNEYYINPYDVEVLIFDADTDTFVERASMVRATPANTYHEYQLNGTLTKVEKNADYHIVVLANLNGASYCNNFSTPAATATMTEFLEGLTYTGYDKDFTSKIINEDAAGRIPMWGITTTTLQDGITVSLDLLRAMAKVKVKMAKGGGLSGVALSIANAGGHVTPTMQTGTSTDGKTQRVRATHIPDGISTINGITTENILTFSKINDTEDNEYDEYVIFIPEYMNLNSGATVPANALSTAASIKLTVGSGESAKDYRIEFKDYTNNTGYFDIIRNYYYEYEVSVSENYANMVVLISINPWNNYQFTYDNVIIDGK